MYILESPSQILDGTGWGSCRVIKSRCGTKNKNEKLGFNSDIGLVGE